MSELDPSVTGVPGEINEDKPTSWMNDPRRFPLAGEHLSDYMRRQENLVFEYTFGFDPTIPRDENPLDALPQEELDRRAGEFFAIRRTMSTFVWVGMFKKGGSPQGDESGK